VPAGPPPKTVTLTEANDPSENPGISRATEDFVVVGANRSLARTDLIHENSALRKVLSQY